MSLRSIRFCSVALLVLFALTSRAQVPEGLAVSEEGLRLFGEHRRFVEDSREFSPEVRTHINFQDERFYSMAFFSGELTVEGEAVLALPPAAVRHWRRWRELRVAGERATSLRVFLRGPDDVRRQLNNWWNAEAQNTQYLRVGTATPDGSSEDGWHLVFVGQGTVERVALGSIHGVPTEFDFMPYTTLGADRPPERGTLHVDATRRRVIQGKGEFDHSKYYRLYASPTASPLGDAAMAQAYIMGKNFAPGRQQFKFSGLTRSSWLQPHLVEDPARPGWHDPGWVERFVEANRDPRRRDAYLAFFPTAAFDYAMCFDNWPDFMEIRDLPNGVFNQRGTPDKELFGAAAQLASDWIRIEKELQGRTATWWQVKNETDIAYEWAYHRMPDEDGWELLAEFHNVVAQTIRRDHPEVKVGGPTACNVNFTTRDFASAANYFEFFDRTRDHLDFYSFHYYGGFDMLRGGPSDFLLGGMQANTDLMVNYLEATGNRKPILVSEGGGTGGRDSFTHFRQIHGNSSVMSFFVNHPDVFCLTTLFTLPVTWWDRTRPSSIFVYTEDGRFTVSPQALFLELWGDHLGTRIPVRCDVPDVRTHAVVSPEGVVSVMVNNLRPRRLELDLRTLLEPGSDLVSVRQKRLYLEVGEITYEVVDADPTRIEVAGCETTQIRLSPSAPPQLAGVLHERTFYGDRVMLRGDGGAATVEVRADPGDIERSLLRVGYRPDRGSTPVSVRFNGEELAAIEAAPLDGGLVSLVFELPPERVRESNTVAFVDVPEGGVVASVLLVNAYRE